jgi:hypothetical protein
MLMRIALFRRVADVVVVIRVTTDKYSPLQAVVRVVLLFVVMVTWQWVQVSRDAPFGLGAAKKLPSKGRGAHLIALVLILRRTQLRLKGRSLINYITKLILP